MFRTFFILFLIFPIIAEAQIIEGQIFEEGTNKVVEKASVYYSGSITGTLSNEQGIFKLQASTNQTPITVSCIGYFTETISNYTVGQRLNVYLRPKALVLDEVVVVAENGMSRAEKIKIFKKEFLGTSEFALSCSILNINDLKLLYNKKNKTLIAQCNQPLIIENKKLGYSLQYFLDDFIKTERNTSFSGNFIFTELKGASKKEDILLNRKIAYRGSRMQFIRALCANQLKENGFKIFDALYEPIPIDSLIKDDGAEGRIMKLKQRVLITYKNNFSRLTYLSQTKANSYINASGFYDNGLRWSGDMTAQRIGDLLPFEYQYQPHAEDDLSQNMIIKPVKGVGSKALPYAFVLMKNIALVPNNHLDQTPVVKKWQSAIHYKVYGTFGKQNDARVTEFFEQLHLLTGLEIKAASSDGEVNFQILAGGNPDRFKEVITPEALLYLKNPNVDRSYYTTNQNGFLSMVQMIDLYRRPPEDVVWAMLQKAILKGLGFFGYLEDQEQSLFYQRLNITPLQIQEFDVKIIKWLYHPLIKSGMTGPELNEIAIRNNIE